MYAYRFVTLIMILKCRTDMNFFNRFCNVFYTVSWNLATAYFCQDFFKDICVFNGAHIFDLICVFFFFAYFKLKCNFNILCVLDLACVLGAYFNTLYLPKRRFNHDLPSLSPIPRFIVLVSTKYCHVCVLTFCYLYFIGIGMQVLQNCIRCRKKCSSRICMYWYYDIWFFSKSI